MEERGKWGSGLGRVEGCERVKRLQAVEPTGLPVVTQADARLCLRVSEKSYPHTLKRAPRPATRAAIDTRSRRPTPSHARVRVSGLAPYGTV
jgi:hypothetical protein